MHQMQLRTCLVDVKNYLPPIDVSVYVHFVDSININAKTFYADITVRLDWEDPSLALKSGKFALTIAA